MSPWLKYSKKLIQRIENPRHAGMLTQDERRGMRLVRGQEGNFVTFYWFVDEEDGVIAEAKFQAFGPSILIGLAEIACEWVMRKNYDQARRVTAELLDKHARDPGGSPAFEASGYMQWILGAISNAAEMCMDIPITTIHVPLPQEGTKAGTPYPGWATLSLDQQKRIVEELLDQEVRPYVALDAGGVDLVDIRQGREVIIAYQGACTTCFSATGSTLDAIQQVLRAHIDPEIAVIPDLSKLML